MAKLANLKIYKQAEAGKRVFTMRPADAPAVYMGLLRRGYTVRQKTDKSNVTTITIR